MQSPPCSTMKKICQKRGSQSIGVYRSSPLLRTFVANRSQSVVRAGGGHVPSIGRRPHGQRLERDQHPPTAGAAPAQNAPGAPLVPSNNAREPVEPGNQPAGQPLVAPTTPHRDPAEGDGQRLDHWRDAGIVALLPRFALTARSTANVSSARREKVLTECHPAASSVAIVG